MPDNHRQNRRGNRQNTGNPIAQNPLLRKGGVHEKSNSAKRQSAKRDLQQRARAWRNSLARYTGIFRCAHSGNTAALLRIA